MPCGLTGHMQMWKYMLFWKQRGYFSSKQAGNIKWDRDLRILSLGLSRAFFLSFLRPIPKYVLKTQEAAYCSWKTQTHCCTDFTATLAPLATQERLSLPPSQESPRVPPTVAPSTAAAATRNRRRPDGGSAVGRAGTAGGGRAAGRDALQGGRAGRR